MSYAEFSGRPSYIRATGDSPTPHDEQQWKWSGEGELPKIGAKVLVTMNDIGEAIVEKYFVEGGWVGVLARPVNPPAWLVDKVGRGLVTVFGAEIKEVAE